MSRKHKLYIKAGEDWNGLPDIDRIASECRIIAGELGLECYPVRYDIISSNQMMDLYATTGMPMYHHWSLGKHRVLIEQNYTRGAMGLAYELVINSDPCIVYLMEENTRLMQVLVMAHAGVGHNAFFKGNYLFKDTHPELIIDYLLYAMGFIAECEEKYGLNEVELLIDACHSLKGYGVDIGRRREELSLKESERQRRERAEHTQEQVSLLWNKTVPHKDKPEVDEHDEKLPKEPEENILWFIQKYAPTLKSWEREIINIVRNIAQYFYPQRQTQVLNEGFATFTHYEIINRLYDKGLVNDGAMIEFLQSHTSVIYQPPYDSPFYSGINVYALGFKMFTDVKRMCEKPTDEDREWFPYIVGRPWLDVMNGMFRDYRDESAILQFLSPSVIRDMRLFSVVDDEKESQLEISAIHREDSLMSDDGYSRVRKALASQYDPSFKTPDIFVKGVDMKSRRVTLMHNDVNGRPLEYDHAQAAVNHFEHLWKFPVVLNTVDGRNRQLIKSK